MKKLAGIVALLLCGLAFAESDYGAYGYGMTGYATKGYGEVVADTLNAFESFLQESSDTSSEVVEEHPLLPAGDGSLGYRVALQRGWLNFSDADIDAMFKDMTAIGLSFGGFKSFGHGNMFEFVPGFELDLRMFWGNYRYPYYDKLRSRLGLLFTMDFRSTFLFRLNWSIFYVEAGPQFGFNILQSSMIKYEEALGIPNEEHATFIFAMVPGFGVRYKNTDIGIRLVPDISDCWKKSQASMMSIQVAITFWN